MHGKMKNGLLKISLLFVAITVVVVVADDDNVMKTSSLYCMRFMLRNRMNASLLFANKNTNTHASIQKNLKHQYQYMNEEQVLGIESLVCFAIFWDDGWYLRTRRRSVFAAFGFHSKIWCFCGYNCVHARTLYTHTL